MAQLRQGSPAAASERVPADGRRHRLRVQGVGGICTAAGVRAPHELGLISATGADGKKYVLTGTDNFGIDNVCQ
jgi:hypothetical protein